MSRKYITCTSSAIINPFKTTGLNLWLVLNFNTDLKKNGVKRMAL